MLSHQDVHRDFGGRESLNFLLDIVVLALPS
jgi:hypothetical protein